MIINFLIVINKNKYKIFSKQKEKKNNIQIEIKPCGLSSGCSSFSKTMLILPKVVDKINLF